MIYSKLCEALKERIRPTILYVANIISGEELKRRFFSDLNPEKLKRYEDEELIELIQEKTLEIHGLWRIKSQDPIIKDLTKGLVEIIRDVLTTTEPRVNVNLRIVKIPIGKRRRLHRSSNTVIKLIQGIRIMISEMDPKSTKELHEILSLAEKG